VAFTQYRGMVLEVQSADNGSVAAFRHEPSACIAATVQELSVQLIIESRRGLCCEQTKALDMPAAAADQTTSTSVEVR